MREFSVKASRSFVIFVIMLSWVFSGFPQFFGFPSPPSQVYAQQIAFPNADLDDGGWTPTPVYQQINSAGIDDDTFVNSGNNPGTGDAFEVALEEVVDPNTNEGHLIRIRARKDGGARDGLIRVDLYQGTTLIQEGSFRGPLSDGAFDTYTENIDPSNADAITDYSDLSIVVVPDQSGGGQPTSIDVSWLQFEVPSVAAAGPPTVDMLDVFNIQSDEAMAEGEVLDDQGGTITQRGFVWDTQSHGQPGSENTPGDTYAFNIAQSGEFGEGTWTNLLLSGIEHATTYYVRAYAENSEGYGYSSNELQFTTASVAPFVETLTPDTVGQFDAEGRGEVTDTGGETIDERGFVWSVSSQGDPGDVAPGSSGYDDFVDETGLFGAEEFSLLIDGLDKDTTYHYRAFARSSEGYSYGDEVEFQTTGDLPTVSTDDPTGITQTTAEGQGQVTDQGASSISERGFVWSTSPQSNPGNVAPGSSGYDDFVDETGSFGEVSFSLTLEGLVDETVYYYRAYAENSEGFAYGSEVEFQTLDSRPAVFTDDAESIETRSADGVGEVMGAAGETIEERGFVWSTSSQSDPGDVAPGSSGYDDSVAETGSFGEDPFMLPLELLRFDTTYYYRAYAWSTEGYGYGEERSFITADAQFGRPDGDVVVDGWSSEPLWSKINDDFPDDADEVLSQRGAEDDTFEVSLSGLDDPLNDDDHYLRYRIRRDGLTACTLDVELRDGGVVVATDSLLDADIEDEYQNYTFALSGAEAGSIGDYSDLRVRMIANCDGGGPQGDRSRIRASWAELEIPLPPDFDTPSVSTDQPEERGADFIIGKGNITSDGDLAIDERGFVWGQSSQPQPDSETAPSGSGYDDFFSDINGPFNEGEFTEMLAGLEPDTVYFYRAYAENDLGYGYGNEIAFITFSDVPTVHTLGAENVTSDSADGRGEVENEGLSEVTERGFVFGTSSLGDPGGVSPDASGYDDFVSETGTFEEEEFVLTMDELNTDTVYYFRAFAENEDGYSYGQEMDFQTFGDLPVVSTDEADNIQQTQADGHGEIEQEGLTTPTERGFVWGRVSRENPGNVAPDDEEFLYANFVNETGTFSTGTFSLTMDDLQEGAVYYYRAYAENDQGYSYGEEMEFTTSSSRPILLTDEATNVEFDGARGHGEIVSEGDSPVIERGFVWSTQSWGDPGTTGPGPSPYEDNILQSGTFEEGLYSMFLASLDDNTTYFYRSVARNNQGWSYGNEMEFTTPEEPLPPEITDAQLNGEVDIALMEGDTTEVGVSAVVSDPNGWEDLDEGSLEGVVYRSGLGNSCTDDENNCYPVNNLELANCAGTTCEIVGSVDMQFFTEPTDIGDFETQHWEFWVYIEDSTELDDEATSSEPVDVLTLVALSVNDDIDYGELEIGQDTGSSNQQTIVRNTGNATIETLVSGDDMTAGSSIIDVFRQEWGLAAFTYGSGESLTDEEAETGIELSKPTSITPVEAPLYWGIGLPGTTLSTGEYQGVNYFTAGLVDE